MDHESKRIILSRRARLVSAALAAAGVALSGSQAPAGEDGGAPSGDASIESAGASTLLRAPLPFPVLVKPPDAAMTEVRRAVEDATHARRRGELTTAARLLLQAYGAYSHWRLLLSLAEVASEAGDDALAVAAYERYLVDGGAVMDARAPSRAEIDALLAKATSRLARLEIVLRGPPAEVHIDGLRVDAAAIAAGVRLGAGAHVVRVTGGGSARDTSVSVERGETKRLEIDVGDPAGPTQWPGPCLSIARPCLSPPGPRAGCCGPPKPERNPG